jgi:dTDP-4-dehydrorhamnose 3,5-epimerase-like enzyme
MCTTYCKIRISSQNNVGIKAMIIDKPKIINLSKIIDARGNLSVIEEHKDIPFKIKRTYWIYNAPGGEVRGGHAYKKNEEFIVALSGSFDVLLDNGIEVKTFSLNRPYYGLYVPNGVWRQMMNFSTNALALILASTHFDLSDYIYDYDLFKNQNK